MHIFTLNCFVFFVAICYLRAANGQNTEPPSCEERGVIERCANRFSYNLSLDEVFHMMSSNPELIPFYCARNRMQTCLGTCANNFRLTNYGHTYSMCIFKRDIINNKRCWMGNFPREAHVCYRHHYPDYRTSALYPVPIREYTTSSIGQDCFPDEQDEDCKYYKSLLLWNLMPNYYQELWHRHQFTDRLMFA